jgi:hypothetical protein
MLVCICELLDYFFWCLPVLTRGVSVCFVRFHFWQFRDKVALGEVRGSNALVSSMFNVNVYPTLLFLCDGDKSVTFKYEGQVTVMFNYLQFDHLHFL